MPIKHTPVGKFLDFVSLFIAIIVVLIIIFGSGCTGIKHSVVRPDKNPPQLRTRPNFNKPHYSVPTYCIQKIEYYDGWCEDGIAPGELLCHDMIVKIPAGCVTVSVK